MTPRSALYREHAEELRIVSEPIQELWIHDQAVDLVKRRSMRRIMEAEEGCDGAGVALEVSRQAAVAACPSEGSFDNPALGEDDKLVGIGALDDLDGPAACLSDRLSGLWPLIAGICEDALDEGEGSARLAKNLADAVAVLN